MSASFVISPSSNIKFIWDMFTLLVALGICLLIPFVVSMEPPFALTGIYQGVMIGVDAFFAVDILVSFRSATFDIVSGEEINEPAKIAKAYVFSTRFLVDILCAIPWHQFGTADIFKLLGLFKILRMFRLGAML